MAFNVLMLLLPLALFSCYYQSEVWTDFRYVARNELDASNNTNLSSYCTKPGLQCADCQTSILCRIVEGNYVATPYETCTAPETCDEGVCTPTPNNVCLKHEYECQSVEGMYPDPNSCTKFHYCTPSTTEKLNHIESECDNDYYYNPLTTYCDKKLLLNKTCPVSSIPKCIRPAQSGALKENPTIYYTCILVKPKILYPVLDACKYGKKYDNTTYTCK